MNAGLLRARAAVLAAMRGWFHDHGYAEVHTPVLVGSPAMEEHLEPVAAGPHFLHTSPEFAMKRVLAAGLCRIYQIVPCFREEEQGRHHSREFTMLEWYRVGAGTAELMDEVEALLGAAAGALGLPAPVFERCAVTSLLEDTGDPDAWFHTWVDRVEPTLTRPVMVHGYPPWQAALARIRGEVADRFEVYLGGIELANAFHEEIDAEALRARWEQANALRVRHGRAPHPIDEALLTATRHMPRCAGIALGVDRLIMALTRTTDISEVQVR